MWQKIKVKGGPLEEGSRRNMACVLNAMLAPRAEHEALRGTT